MKLNTVQHPMATEVQNTLVQKLIRYYHAIIHASIVAAVVIYQNDDNVFIYNNEPRDTMKENDVTYYGFEKDLDVGGAVECTSAGREVDTYDQYIGTELQLPNKNGMKWMERVCQRLLDADGNTEGIGNYRAWTDQSTSKLTTNIIVENMLSQVD